MENLLPRSVRGVNYQLLAVILLKQPNGQLPVAVDHSQLQTMTSETRDPIFWPLPQPFTGSTHLSVKIKQECSKRDSIPGPSEHFATALPKRPQSG